MERSGIRGAVLSCATPRIKVGNWLSRYRTLSVLVAAAFMAAVIFAQVGPEARVWVLHLLLWLCAPFSLVVAAALMLASTLVGFNVYALPFKVSEVFGTFFWCFVYFLCLVLQWYWLTCKWLDWRGPRAARKGARPEGALWGSKRSSD